jgi:hypothetical protein
MLGIRGRGDRLGGTCEKKEGDGGAKDSGQDELEERRDGGVRLRNDLEMESTRRMGGSPAGRAPVSWRNQGAGEDRAEGTGKSGWAQGRWTSARA